MATVLAAGDIAIVQYNSATTDTFTFVFLRDVEVGTTVNFTDNGWLAAGGFRPGEGTVTYTAAGAITAGTIVTLSGLDLDDVGDQIIAYQGDPATPTILHVVDLADGNNTVAGDATNDNTTALPPGFTLDVNAVAVGFDNAVYAGPNSGPPAELFAAINDPANWISSVSPSALYFFNSRPDIDLDGNNSTSFGEDYRANVISGGPAVAIADADTDIDDFDDFTIFRAEIDIQGTDPGDLLSVNTALLPFGISASAFNPSNGTLTLFGAGSHSDYQNAIELVRFSTVQPVGTHKTIAVSVFDGHEWSSEAYAYLTVSSAANRPALDLDLNNSNGGGSDYTATFTVGGPSIAVADTDVSITDADSTTMSSAKITIGINRSPGDQLVAWALPAGITASSYDSSTGVLALSGTATLADYQTALRAVTFTTTNPFTADRIITVTVNDGTLNSNTATTYMHVAAAPPNAPPVNTMPGGQSVAEDTALPIAGVSVADSDSSALTTTLNVAHGTLNVNAGAGAGVTGNGSASVIITGTAAQISAALAGLTYTGNLDFNGADTLTIATSDTIATDTDTIAITVDAVNDPPVNTVPGAQSVAEDTLLSIAGVTVADVDNSALTTTLNVSHGTLNVTAGIGVTGNGTANITITGTAAQINAALAGLAYTGNLDFNGADTLTVATSGGSAVDTDTIAITVNAVNDAPVNTLPGGQSVAEDTLLSIAGVSVADVDSSTLTTTLSVSSGTINVTAGAGVSGNGSANVSITGTAAQINTALAGLAYTGSLNFNGADILTVATSDGTAIDTDTIAITVNPVNDQPALDLDANNSTTPGANYLTGFTELGLAVAIADDDVDISDVDGATNIVSATITLTNHQTGDVLSAAGLPGGITASGYNSTTGVLTLSGSASLADYEAALHLVQFDNPNPNPSNVTRVINVVVNDGASDSNTAKAFVQVELVNNSAPVVDLDTDNSGGSVRSTFRTTFTENGAAVPIADTDVSITDPDIGATIASATITLTNPHTDDLLTVGGGVPLGITASAYNPVTGVLTLTGTATPDEYETALQQIFYSNSGDDPGTEDRLIDVVVNDGVNDSNVAAAVIGVAAVNDAPALVVAATASFVENAAAVSLSPSASLTDVDTDLIFAAVQITDGSFSGDGDVLSVNGATGGTTSGITFTWSPTLHALVFNGTSSVANYQALLQAVQFQSTSDDPTDFGASLQRTLAWSVSDGAAITTAATTVDITAVNDAPALDLDADNSATPGANYLTAFTDGGPAVAIVDTDALITDSDDTELTSATVTLTNPDTDDILAFNGTPPTGITPSAYNPGTGILTLTGAASLAAYQAALRQIAFDNTGTTPSTDPRIIDVVVNDGTAASNLAQTTIAVTQVNDAVPAVDLDANDSTAAGTSFHAAFTEGGASTAIADIDTLITDADSAILASATITLTNLHTGDLLSVSGGLPGGITASVYNPITGVLTLAGSATLAQYQAALQQISYSNSGDNPATEDRLIDVVVNDGANDSNVAAAVISVAAVNDAPALIVAANASFLENAAPVLLSPSVDLADLDDTNLEFASVQITDGSFSGDGDELTAGGLTNGTVNGITFAWDAAQHALVFNGTSSVANYQALLQTVGFQSTSHNPTDFGTSPQRTLTWTVSDGADATVATSSVNIAAVNDAPQETVDANAAYTENGPPVSPITISPGATASDIDNVNLVSGVVRIVDGWFDGDLLTVNGLQSGIFLGIDFAYDAGLRALVFTHPASVADYQAFMQAVEFSSISDNPTNFGANPTRTLRWGLSDGNNYSAAAGSTEIIITAVDDPAVAQNDAVSTTENTAVTTGNVLTDNGFGADSDPDSVAFLVTAVSGGTVGAQFALPSGALLTLNANGAFSYDPNHLFDYLPTPGSGASNLTVTDTFSYTVTGGDTATVTVTVSGVDTNDTLRDSPGNDTLAGGIGDDLYYVSNAGDVVIETASAGLDTVAASENYTLPASNTVEVLNVLGPGLTGTGSEGPETLISSFGANTLIGLGGDDVYYVRDTGDVVIEAAGAGFDTAAASVNYTLPASNTVEVLNMIGAGLTGTGSNGAETFISSSGPNTLVGLDGNDTYYVNSTGDVVIEAANGGIDTVAASVDYTMPDNIEGLYMLGSGLTGTGTNNADSLLSSGGPNTLVGLGGDDLYYANNAADEVIEAANGGYDTVVATVDYTLPDNVEALYVSGSGLTGSGNSGANTLVTLGANTLVGGDGNDMFVLSAGSANGATVADFDRSEGDVLVFSGFGTETQGATISQIGSTDQWQLHSGLDAHNETITFANHAALQAGDFVFV